MNARNALENFMMKVLSSRVCREECASRLEGEMEER